MKALVTHVQLLEQLEYDSETGIFRWRGRRAGRKRSQAGPKFPKGRFTICIDGRKYFAHRLAWFYVTRQWPAADIDHIDGDPSNARFKNLREATRAQNLQNLRQPRRKNSDGLLGATPFGKRWRARIGLNYQTFKIGVFDTPQEAHAAYVEAKRRLHAFGTL